MPLYVRSPLSSDVEAIAEDVVDSACEVKRVLGRGFLERGYAAALGKELRLRGHSVEREVTLPFNYKGEEITGGYRLDLWVDRKIIVECKTVEEFRKEHYGQVATYLRLTGNRLGLLVNFDAVPFRYGVKRVIR